MVVTFARTTEGAVYTWAHVRAYVQGNAFSLVLDSKQSFVAKAVRPNQEDKTALVVNRKENETSKKKVASAFHYGV